MNTKSSKSWHKRQSRKKALRYQKRSDSVRGKMSLSRYNWGDGPKRSNPSNDPQDEA